jgi:signal transduction histidine kinase
MHKLIFRPFIVIGIILIFLIIVELVALGSITWRNHSRIDAIKQDIEQGNQFQQSIFELLNQGSSKCALIPSPEQVKQQSTLESRFIKEIKSRYVLPRNSDKYLNELKALITRPTQDTHINKCHVLQLLNNELLERITKEENLLDEVYLDSQLELKLAISIPAIIFLILSFLGYILLNRHIILPANELEKLLSNLIQGKKQPIEDTPIESVMRPLFDNYNRLVNRLSELENEHKVHTTSLENEVHSATHTLLEQNLSLGRADRLAAVGVLAASTAHELRNPLAAIQAALENMEIDCDDTDLKARLQLVNLETKKLTTKLNSLLSYSKQQPEEIRRINLEEIIRKLIALVKYQVKDNITLHFNVDKNIHYLLPENEFRQALLNLLINAIQSIGNKNGRVDVDVYHLNSQLVIKVRDTGEPLPQSLLDHGVRPFISYKENGTGLGLPMVKRFVEAYEGKLELMNDESGYACISLLLPEKR